MHAASNAGDSLCAIRAGKCLNLECRLIRAKIRLYEVDSRNDSRLYLACMKLNVKKDTMWVIVLRFVVLSDNRTDIRMVF